MRIIDTKEVIPIIKNLCKKACYALDEDFIEVLKASFEKEESPLGKEILESLIENAIYAKKEQVACCQDTGITIVHMEIGQEVTWEGIPLIDAINEGVRQGYVEGYLRKSVVQDPILRKNTGDNTPAVVRTEIVAGDQVKVTIMPKGAGSENMSRLKMLTPADGIKGIKEFVIETIELAGGKACPPYIVGIGIGGTMDLAAWLAKKSLERPIGDRNKAEHLAALEIELRDIINDLGLGPLGLGGRVTALDVHIEAYACHIASLPIAVNLQCHANRHAVVTI
ncbi:fumarate hydratase [Clostridium formicaceticum]|uniref:Fumarate hydratase n=1 Tax=Clostridium formicaceticum TaxID=1497 RepID=A0AAC9RHM1_9CLOT|nr:fumarate hydratase [Clostridium formicaceticum]AOY75424.1 fumarate hydratase [Clostridium formicaceticum]ARE85704.1 L(+)-tartrate dehydratase subunit alpha [Clostridium formicaceticum]